MSPRVLVSAASAALLVSVLLATSATAEQKAIPAGNLVQNPGGELGQGTADNNASLPLRGWEREVTPEVANPEVSGFTPARYGGHAYFPTPALSKAIGGGRNFFYAGIPAGGQHVGHTSTATQTIAVGRAAAEIDVGGVKACLSAYLGGARDWPQYTIRIEVEFLGEEGNRLGQFRIGPMSAAQRSFTDPRQRYEAYLLRRSAFSIVPRGTRELRVVMVGASTEGGPVYGYADNVTVALTKGTCEPALAVRCVRGALVATVTPSEVMRTQRVRFAVKGGKRTKQAQDGRAPYSARFPMAGFSGRLQVTATVTVAGSGPIVLTKKSRRC